MSVKQQLQSMGRWLRRGEARASVPSAEVHTRVLMVCMGNICRSPTAEAVLRSKLAQAGLAHHVEVDSAGTHGYHTGEGPDPRAVAAAARRGYDLAALRARPVQADDFERFDLVLAMDQNNLHWLRHRAPAAPVARIDLLLAHARQHGVNFGDELNALAAITLGLELIGPVLVQRVLMLAKETHEIKER